MYIIYLQEEYIMNKNQKINCTVKSCAYNNPNCTCGLEQIKVAPCKGCNTGNPEDESMCNNYKSND